MARGGTRAGAEGQKKRDRDMPPVESSPDGGGRRRGPKGLAARKRSEEGPDTRHCRPGEKPVDDDDVEGEDRRAVSPAKERGRVRVRRRSRSSVDSARAPARIDRKPREQPATTVEKADAITVAEEVNR